MIENVAQKDITLPPPLRGNDVRTSFPASHNRQSGWRAAKDEVTGGGANEFPENPVLQTRSYSGGIGPAATRLQTSTQAKGNISQFSLEPLQEWEGYVTEIREDTFVARLIDVSASQNVEEEVADFLISDLSHDDLFLLKEGAVFRWVIGYQRRRSGQKIRASQIVFRRLPAWSKRDLQRSQAHARELSSRLTWY